MVTKKEVLKEMMDQKLQQAGIAEDISMDIPQGMSEEQIKNLFYEESSEIPLEWSGVFNVLTRMYEISDSYYNHVRFDVKGQFIEVELDKPEGFDIDKELNRIETMVGNMTLQYVPIDAGDKVYFRIGRKGTDLKKK